MRVLHHLASRASLFQQWKDYNSITIASLFSPTRTHFEKGMAASIYQTRSTARPILVTWKLNTQPCTKSYEIWIYIYIWKRDNIYMQISLLNMYKLDLQTYMIWDTEKQVILLAQLHSYWFSWIIQARQGSDAEIERKTNNINSRKTMLIPHTWEHYTI